MKTSSDELFDLKSLVHHAENISLRLQIGSPRIILEYSDRNAVDFVIRWIKMNLTPDNFEVNWSDFLDEKIKLFGVEVVFRRKDYPDNTVAERSGQSSPTPPHKRG